MIRDKGITIKYGDIAPEAAKKFDVTSNDSEEFVNFENFKYSGISHPKYVNPCEGYSVGLNGRGIPFPSNPENENMGYWSETISDNEGGIGAITFTIHGEEYFTSSGITIQFDEATGIYATDVLIRWYSDDELLSEQRYQPNSTTYFFENEVTGYNRISINFFSLNAPYARLKIKSIEYGHNVFIYGEDLRNVKITQEIDPISSTVSVNTSDIILDSTRTSDYNFQGRQPVEIYFNGKLKSKTFVKNYKRTSKVLWNLKTEDYIGQLERIPFVGGIYNEKNVGDLLDEIFTTANVPYQLGDGVSTQTVTGYIPYTTCREALKQVAFAIQAVVNTAESEVVKIYYINESISQNIPLSRIKQGQSFDVSTATTGISVTGHGYNISDESIELYTADQGGVGDNIFVKFTEPVHSLNIVNGNIVEGYTNYAVIRANSGCVLTGKKYEHFTFVKSKKRKVVSSEVESIAEVTNATLVSHANIDNVVEKCYNWITRGTAVNLGIYEGYDRIPQEVAVYGYTVYGTARYGVNESAVEVPQQTTSVGDIVSVETEYLGDIVGTIYKQTYGLNGGIILKETAVR